MNKEVHELKDLISLIAYLKDSEVPVTFTEYLEESVKSAPSHLLVSPPKSMWAIKFHDDLEEYFPTYYRALFKAPKEELPKILNDDIVTTAIVNWRLERLNLRTNT